MTDIENLEKELAYYKKILGVGDFNPATNGYAVLVDQLRQRTEYLKKFKLEEKIGNAAKDDPVYSRAMDLIKELPNMISSVNNLKLELKIDFNEDEGKARLLPTSPQNIGIN